MDRVGGSGTSQPLSKPARNPSGRAPRGSALRGSALRDSDPKDRTPKDRAPKDSDPRGRAQALRRTAALSLNSNGIQSNCVSTETHKVCNAMALFDSPRGPPLAPTGLAHPAAMDPPAPLPRSPSPSPALRRSGASPAPSRRPPNCPRTPPPLIQPLRTPRNRSSAAPPRTPPGASALEPLAGRASIRADRSKQHRSRPGAGRPCRMVKESPSRRSDARGCGGIGRRASFRY